MKIFSGCLLCLMLLSCSTTRYYIVRHAEKESAATMTSGVPLSDQGRQRALSLKNVLINKNVQRIFSTNYARTLATAQPLSTATGISIETYQPADSTFSNRLKEVSRGNVFIVGHSNTVDDIVNGLMGKERLQDLPDTQYGD
jgi:2,3-bisphosphoglycerate-dependent phosphoglycerate mutase